MRDCLRFYGYGRTLAPKDWHFADLPIANRLYVTYAGSAWYFDGQKEQPFLPGHLYLFPHRLPFHAHQSPEDRLDHMFFDFILTPPLLSEHVTELVPQPDSLLYHSVSALERLISQQHMFSSSAFAELLENYFLSLLSLVCIEGGHHRLSDPRLDIVLNRIHSENDWQATNRQLADMVHLEVNYFIRIFHQSIGLTPHQYILQHRLNVATSELLRGSSVTETARLCGYESTAALSHAMRKIRGIAPSDFIVTGHGARRGKKAPPF